jgi:DNA-binding Lrp family transcriptional regulator
VHLSIDSVNNRIKELQRKGVFSFTISIDPRIIGYAIVADVKIKLQNLAPKAKDSFVAYLVRHANVTDVLGIVGDFDITCVIVAKDTKELDEVSNHIRERFSSLIADWKTVLVTRTYKFDTYTLE